MARRGGAVPGEGGATGAQGAELAAEGVAGGRGPLGQLLLVAAEHVDQGARLGEVGGAERRGVTGDDACLQHPALGVEGREALEVGVGEGGGLRELQLAQAAEVSQQG